MERGSQAYLGLKEQVTQAGILRRDYGFYVFLFILSVIGLITSLTYIFKLPIGLPLALWTVIFGFFTVQCG